MLVEAQLKQSLLSLFDEMDEAVNDKEKGKPMTNSDYAGKLAAIITGYIKTAQVNPGISVSTSGSAAAQTGATTSTGVLS